MKGSCSNFRPSGDRYLVIATSNENKFFEIRSAIGSITIPIYSLKDFPGVSEAPETGATFEETARQKAEFYFGKLQKPVLAEDSGLVIPALDGFPGVLSARVAPDDPSRIRIILEKLQHRSDRSAYYICSMVFITENNMYAVEGRCDGEITEAPDGDLGFGYDPVFRPQGCCKTFGRMTVKEKSLSSHRGRAVQLMIPHLLAELLGPAQK